MSDPRLEAVLWERMLIWKRQGRLAMLDWSGSRARHEAMARLLELADDSFGLPDFEPLTLSTGDRPCSNDPGCITLGFSQADGHTDVAIPDFVFDRWPVAGVADYAETTWEVAHAGASPPQQPVCGWTGGVSRPLLEIAAARPDLIEAGSTTSLTPPEQARRWASLIDVAADGYSPRLKILLHSGRPVLIQDRPWREWYWSELEPMRNFIPIKRDLSDLVDMLVWVREHPREAEEIGRAGQALALTMLTREAALLQLAQTLVRLAGEHNDASDVAERPRTPLDPALERLGASA